MDAQKVCPPCLIGRVIAGGLLLWGLWALVRHFMA